MMYLDMIATPTKQIFVQMIRDEWILPEHATSAKVNIELVLMYQSGVNILMSESIDYDQDRYTKVKIQDQIDLHKDHIFHLKRQKKLDYYDAEMLHIHRNQLGILENLRAILIAQYN